MPIPNHVLFEVLVLFLKAFYSHVLLLRTLGDSSSPTQLLSSLNRNCPSKWIYIKMAKITDDDRHSLCTFSTCTGGGELTRASEVILYIRPDGMSQPWTGSS